MKLLLVGAALYWPGAERMTVAGIIGLGALASVIALAGARRTQRRARRIAQRR